ncbi:hypothetical protein L3Q82_010916, partial [Scortum barcoo]
KDELPLVTETDKLSSHPVDDAGGVLPESHTSKDASADASSHPDCKRLGKSLEGEPPGGCNLPAGNDEDGRQVQSRVSQIQAFTLSSSDEEVRCRPDCTYEDMLRDTGFCNTWSQSSEVEKSNQRRDEPRVCENIFFSKEKEESNSPSDYADSKTFCSSPEEGSSGNLMESVKNEEKILELQICENENVTACDGETKGKVNENGMSKNSIPSVAERAGGSVVSNDLLLARNIAIEDVSPEADNLCWPKGEHAAEKMIAKAWSEMADHTAETPMPARISQELAEGDNDAGPFCVIDPAIWSETDREAGEKQCFSGSTTEVALSPSVKVCTTETRPPFCADIRLSQEPSAVDQTGTFNHQSKTQQGQDENKELCQSHTEPQASSISTDKAHNTINEAGFLWKSSPSSSPWHPKNPPPAGDGRCESHGTAGHQLKVQDQSGFSPVSLNHLKTQEVEYLQNEAARMDGATEIKEREEITSFEVEIRADEHGKSENSMDLDKLLQQNMNKEDTGEISTGDCINDWAEGKISKYGNNFTRIDEELKNNLECWSDHAYSVVIPTMEGTTEGQERGDEASVGEEADVHGNSEILVKSEDCHQQRRQQEGDMTEASPDESSSEGTRGNLRESGCKLTQVSQRAQGIRLSCFSDDRHRAETFMSENKDDILAFIFPPTRDAVVPGRHELIHSQNANSNPAALNCSDRFSPVPSACTFYDHVPGGFDTFEKMQLSLDDDDDAGLSNSPVLSSLPGQLLKTPHQQLYHSMPEAESSELPEEEEEGEEEVTRSECHSENMANGFLNSDCSCNELLNFISAADVIPLGWPEQQPNCESACNSSECFQEDLNTESMSSTVFSKSVRPASDVNDSPEFEMKKQFDLVLKELNLYFDISLSDFANDSRSSSPEPGIDTTETLKGDTSNRRDHLSRPELGHHRDTTSDDAGEDCSLDMYEGDPGVSCTSGSGDSEQEVPLGSHLCQEASMYTAKKHREPLEMEQRRKMWSPSLTCGSFLEQLSHSEFHIVTAVKRLKSPTTRAAQETGASENMYKAAPGWTFKESQDQTPTSSPPLQMNTRNADKA